MRRIHEDNIPADEAARRNANWCVRAQAVLDEVQADLENCPADEIAAEDFDRLNTLTRRARWLIARQRRQLHQTNGYDHTEFAALIWAVDHILGIEGAGSGWSSDEDATDADGE